MIIILSSDSAAQYLRYDLLNAITLYTNDF